MKKQKTWKKLAAVLLAAVMAVGILPMSVLAADTYEGVTFSDLQGWITNAETGTVTLPMDVAYDSTVTDEPTTITIDKTITLDLNGHTISGGGANKDSVITIASTGNLTLNDSSTDKTGKITGGLGSKHGSAIIMGGGVYINEGGSLVMNGGSISGNMSDDNGGGVYNRGTFAMLGGEISDNTADYYGGGLCNGGTFIMLGGTISGNKITYGRGGGVYVENVGSIVVGGSVNITDNQKRDSVENVYVYSNCKFTVSDDKPLTTGANIGVSITEYYFEDNDAFILTGTVADDCSGYFTSDNKEFKVTFNTDHLEIVVNEEYYKDMFKDVPLNAFYFKPIKYLATNGYMAGIGNGYYKPKDYCTRAQVVTMLYAVCDKPWAEYSGCFTDVTAGDYYAKAVQWAVENGITSGTGNGKFDPDKVCTRAEVITMLYAAADTNEAEYSGCFTDVTADDYYAKAVQFAVDYGLTAGIGDNKFGPDRKCTRGEIATFIYAGCQPD